MINQVIKQDEEGLGDINASFKVYIGNRPNMDRYRTLNHVMPITLADQAELIKDCGNHWRKIINCYAKIVFEWFKRTDTESKTKQLESKQSESRLLKSWQAYRDRVLLSQHSDQALLFSPPKLTLNPGPNANQLEQQSPLLKNTTFSSATNLSNLKALSLPKINIVMGKSYFNSLQLPIEVDWLDLNFAINRKARLIVCPYFDYRQLTNRHIQKLMLLIRSCDGLDHQNVRRLSMLKKE